MNFPVHPTADSASSPVSTTTGSRTCLLDVRRHLARQVVRLPARGRLGIDAHDVLGAAGTRKTPALAVLADEAVDLILEAGRGDEAALGVLGAEEGAVADVDADEAVGEVGVGVVPLGGAPALVGEDDLDEQEVGEGVADGLVDEVGEGADDLDGGLLRGRLGCVFGDALERLVGEEDGAVAVGFEVDADVESGSGVVEELDACIGTHDG